MRAAIKRWRKRRRLKRAYEAAVVDLIVEQENYRKQLRWDLGWFEKLDLTRSIGDAQERLLAAHAAYEEAKGAR